MQSNIDTFIKTATKELKKSASKMDFVGAFALLQKAVDSNHLIFFTGIGKTSYVAQYAASLISSIATPAFFLDGTEVCHGTAGAIREGDVLIAISNSGNTKELLAAIDAAKNKGAKVIAIVGNNASKLALASDAVVTAHVDNEGGPMNLAPRASILSETLAIQVLSLWLQDHCGLTKEVYKQNHSAGSIGEKLSK